MWLFAAGISACKAGGTPTNVGTTTELATSADRTPTARATSADVNRTTNLVSLHGATVEVPDTWSDVTHYNFLPAGSDIEKVTVSRLGPVPAGQRDNRFEAIRGKFISDVQPYAVSAWSQVTAPTDVREFSIQIAEIPAAESDHEDELGLGPDDEQPVNWLKVAWLSTAHETLHLLAHCRVEQPAAWPSILTRSTPAGTLVHSRNHSREHYQVGGVLVYFPSGVVPPRVFRYAAPEEVERFEALWSTSRESLVLPEPSVVFSDQPSSGVVVREVPHDPNLRFAHRAGWYHNPNDNGDPRFAGMSSHTFARGTLLLTYLAHSTSEALPRWKNLANSVQAEESP